MKNEASAVWEGGLKDGKGTMSAGGGAFKGLNYSFARRFEDAAAHGTNPEELIAAAHAGCFGMATAAALEKAGFKPTRLDVKATVSLEQVEGKPTITASHLELNAAVPDITEPKFREIVDGAKNGCVISRLLKADVSLDARMT